MIATRLGLTIVAITLSVAAAQAAGRGSMEDQVACTPDVYRLCAANVPDEDAIVACLKRNRGALSPACGRVFARPDASAPAQAGEAPDDDQD